MGKQQKSKRARKHKKMARFAKLKENTAHPSHLRKRDDQAKKRYFESKIEKNFK